MAVTSVIGRQIIDLANDTNYYFEVAPQGDSQARYVEITVLNDNNPYPIDPTFTIILEGKNAGGYNIFTSCSKKTGESNVIVVPLTNGVLSYAGVGKYLVAFYDGDDYINSFSFNIVVTEAPYDIVALKASDTYEALNKMITKAADANKWIVEPNDPVSVSNVHINDLFLNSETGNLFTANESYGLITWVPMINPTTGKQLNIMEKIYVRYALDSSGTGISEDPVVGGVARNYIGFYNTVNLPPSSDISDPTSYKWALMKVGIDDTNTVVSYAEDTSYNGTPPSTGWSTTLPTTLTPGACLWTRIHLAFLDGTYVEYYTVTQYGNDAGFGTITSSISPSGGNPVVNITMDPTSPSSARDFDFDFRIRGGTWRSGTVLTGTGTNITTTTFNDSDTIPGDMYLNTNTGNIYICTGTTSSNSTWSFAFTVGSVTNISDLENTRRYYQILPANTEALPHIHGTDAMYTASPSPSDTHHYLWKCYVSRFAVSPKRTSTTVIGSGTIDIDLYFKEQPVAMVVCVEVRRVDV